MDKLPGLLILIQFVHSFDSCSVELLSTVNGFSRLNGRSNDCIAGSAILRLLVLIGPTENGNELIVDDNCNRSVEINFRQRARRFENHTYAHVFNKFIDRRRNLFISIPEYVLHLNEYIPIIYLLL